jgi:HEAT repeat protein
LQDPRRTLWETEVVVRIVSELRQSSSALALRPDLLEDLKAADILVPAAPMKDKRPPLMYTHRTIGEYLTGRALADKLKNKDAREWELVDKKAWDPHWRPVMLFLAGQLAEDPDALNRYLTLCRKPETHPPQDDIFHHRLCLQAEVLAEVPERVQAALDRRVHSLTNAVFDAFWRMQKRLSLLPHMRAAWRAAGQLRGSAEDSPLVSRLLDRLAHRDPSVRELGLQGLGGLGNAAVRDSRSIPALLDRLSDEKSNVSDAAIESLRALREHALRDSRLIPALRVRLSDLRASVRERAVQALGVLPEAALRDSSVIPSLLERLRDSEWLVRASAAEALGNMEGAATYPEVTPALLDCLGDSRWMPRATAVEAMGRMENAETDDRILFALLDRLQDRDSSVRAAAIRALGRFRSVAARDPRIVPAVLAQLNEPEWWLVRSSAAQALGDLGEPAAKNPDVITALLDRFTDPALWVRERAAEALGKLGPRALENPNFIPALLERLLNDDSGVRERAARVLGELGDAVFADHRVTAALLDRLKDWAPWVGDRAVTFLIAAAAHDSRVVTAVMDRLNDRDSAVRERAARILSDLGETGARDPRVAAVLSKRLEEPASWADYRGAALVAAAADFRVIPVVLNQLKNADSSSTRLRALRALRALGEEAGRHPGVLTALMARLKDPDFSVRNEAAGVTVQWGIRIFRSGKLRKRLETRRTDELARVTLL